MSSLPSTADDLHFVCQNCGVQLVIDRSAAGLTLPCQSCGEPTKVPDPESSAAPANAPSLPAEEKAAELERQLKENESQRTEISGYINQLNIQLHRWQLRLQTLNERNQELKAELTRLDENGTSSVANL